MIGWFDANLVTILNGLAIGMLLFTMASGLSLVFGLMNVLNLAHGSLFLLGAYIAYSLSTSSGGFLLALAVAAVAGLAGGAILSLAVRPLEGRGHLDQALLTLGIAFVAADLMAKSWDDDVHSVDAVQPLGGSTQIFDHAYPTYRLGVIAMGLLLALVVYLIVERTTLGALVRAAVEDRNMVAALGVDVRKILIGVFALGGALATIGGVVSAPVLGARPGLDTEVLILALIVVVIGGLGSIKGALVGALIIGQVRVLGVALFPQYASFLLFLAMGAVLAARPSGLFGDVTAKVK